MRVVRGWAMPGKRGQAVVYPPVHERMASAVAALTLELRETLRAPEDPRLQGCRRGTDIAGHVVGSREDGR